MSRRYTAQEMLDAAETCLDLEVAYMLRQAADDLERERKYEYSWMIETGEASLYNRTPSLDVVKMVAPEEATIVRRAVGEWETVDAEDELDGEG